MKRWMSFILSLLLMVSAGFFQPVLAETAEFQVVSRIVRAVAHADRSLSVSEEVILQLSDQSEPSFFLAPRSNDEKVELQDIRLQSEQGTLEQQDQDWIVTWQAPENGRIEYHLDYTLQYFQSDDEARDTLTLNLDETLLGWGTETDHLEYQLTLDEGLIRDNWVLDCGYSQTGSCRLGQGGWQENTFIFRSDEALSGDQVRLRLNFAAGTFVTAPEYQYPAVYERMELEVEIQDNLDIKVHRVAELKVNDPETQLSLDLFFYPYTYPDAEIVDFTCSDPMAQVSTKYGFLDLDQQTQSPVEVEYILRPLRFQGDLRIHLNDHYNQLPIGKLKAVIRLPEATEVETEFYDRDYQPLKDVTLEKSEDGRTLTVTAEKLRDDDDLTLRIPLKQSRFHVAGQDAWMFWQTFTLGMIGAAILFRLLSRPGKVRSGRGLPTGINPLEAGRLYGLKPDSRMMSMVMVNWVARSHLRVVRTGPNQWLFQKDKPMNFQPEWEKALFSQLLGCGDGQQVDSQTLNQAGFQAELDQAVQAALKQGQAMIPPALQFLKWLMLALSLLPVVAAGILYCLQFSGMNILLLLSWLGGLLVIAGGSELLLRPVWRGWKNIVWRIVGGILIYAMLNICADQFIFYQNEIRLCLVLSWISWLLLRKLRPLTRNGAKKRAELDCWLQGLRNQPDRKLYDLLNQDPDYAMKTYPFACALDQRLLWETRFYLMTLPTLSTIVNASGEEESIWALEDLADYFAKLGR